MSHNWLMFMGPWVCFQDGQLEGWGFSSMVQVPASQVQVDPWYKKKVTRMHIPVACQVTYLAGYVRMQTIYMYLKLRYAAQQYCCFLGDVGIVNFG